MGLRTAKYFVPYSLNSSMLFASFRKTHAIRAKIVNRTVNSPIYEKMDKKDKISLHSTMTMLKKSKLGTKHEGYVS